MPLTSQKRLSYAELAGEMGRAGPNGRWSIGDGRGAAPRVIRSGNPRSTDSLFDGVPSVPSVPCSGTHWQRATYLSLIWSYSKMSTVFLLAQYFQMKNRISHRESHPSAAMAPAQGPTKCFGLSLTSGAPLSGTSCTRSGSMRNLWHPTRCSVPKSQWLNSVGCF